MMTSIKQWFTPPVFEGDEEKTRRAGLLNASLNANTILILALIMGQWIGGRTPITIFWLEIIALIINFSSKYWIRRGKIDPPAIVALIVIFLLMTSASAGLGTIRTAAPAMYIPLIVIAGRMFGRRGTTVSLVASSLAVLGLIIAENAGLLPKPDFTVTLTQWVAFTAVFVMTAGLVQYFNQTIQDALMRAENEIVKRKRVEMELRVTEARFRALFEQNHDGVLIFGLDGLTREANQRAADMFGYSREEIRQRKGRDFVVSSNQSENTFARLLAGERIPLIERILQKKDGLTFPVELNIELVRDKDGAPLHIQCIMRDITERKRTEEQLRQFSRIVEASPTSILIVGVKGDIQYTNPKFTQLTGYSLEEVLGKRTEILGTEFTPPETFDQMRTAVMTGNEWNGDLRNRKKNRDLYWEHSSMAPIKNEKGEITHYVGMSEDITHLKKVEEDLKASESRYRAIVEDQTELICRFLPDTTLVFVNQAYCNHFDKQQNEMIGTSYLNVIPPEYHEESIQSLEKLKKPPFKFEVEWEIKSANGDIHWQQWVGRAILNSKDEVTEFQFVGRDITETKKMLQKQYEAATINERQRLARDLHDAVSQTLFSARLTSEMLLQKRGAIATSELWSNIQHFTRLITSALGEMRVLLLELRPENLERANLSSLLGHLVDAAKARTTANIETIVTEKEKIPSNVKVAFYRITQEALNNAIKHANCKNISIACSSDLDYMQLIIEDDGQGVENIKKNEGERMGLNIMEERTREIDGILKVISHPNDGTKISCVWRKKTGGKGAAEKN